MAGYETLILEVRGEVAVVTLNRPKVLHALSARVFDELEAVFKVLGGEREVRVVLLTGLGIRHLPQGRI